MEWSEDSIGLLTAFWAEGLSTAEIGRRLGVSKNAVVGKAHRLNLLARPSPIRRSAERTLERAASARRPSALALPLLSEPAPAVAPLEETPAPGRAVLQASVARPSAPEPAPAAAPVLERPPARLTHVPAPRSSRISACCWPIGEPGKPSFRFCDADAITGKPYCTEHAQLAYVKVRDRREEAA